jgi:hypothetical protein
MSALDSIVEEKDLLLLVDRSGSMEQILTSTLSGLNEFIGSQKLLPNAENTWTTLHTFDDVYETPIPRTKLTQFPEITRNDISPRGMTSLYDAIGRMFADMSMKPCIVVIVTDGIENASKEFTKTQVMDKITQRRELGWTFIFLAANQDAIASGVSIGIPQATACTFNTTPQGIREVFRGASNVVMRASTENTPTEFTALERESSADSELPPPPPPLARFTSVSRSATGYPM